jgi:hypothetical protein
VLKIRDRALIFSTPEREAQTAISLLLEVLRAVAGKKRAAVPGTAALKCYFERDRILGSGATNSR